MKKIIFAICALMLSIPAAEARPHGFHHGGHAPIYHHSHKHHHGDVLAGIIVGAVGASIIDSALRPRTQITPTYAPVVYAPVTTAPAIVTTPAVSQTIINTTTVSQPCYTTTNFVTGATTTHCNSTIVTNSPTTYLYSAN